MSRTLRAIAHDTDPSTWHTGTMTASLFEQCTIKTNSGDALLILQCVTDSLDNRSTAAAADTSAWLLVLAGALIFFMQTGFAMLCAGCVHKKNPQNTMLKNLLNACGAAIAFFAVGFAFAFGGQGESDKITFAGSTNFFNTGDNVDQGFWFFQFAFSATSVTIVAGTLAERCQMMAYWLYSLFLTGFVYPIVAHAIWSDNGFLSPFSADPFQGVGCIDFAGSGVVHVTGGTTALIAAVILGARKGRFHDHRGRLLEDPQPIPGQSMALQLLGTLVLWFGWYGFNPGSALLLPAAKEAGKVAGRAAVNTSLSAAAGAMTAMFAHLYFHERHTGEYKFDLTVTMNGALSGLVAVTGSCSIIENWASFLIGLVAGVIYLGGSSLLVKMKVDDAVDAIPVHLLNGAWGLVAVGLFASPGRLLEAYGKDEHAGWFYSIGKGSMDGTLFLNQLLGLVFILGWVTATMLPFYLWLNYMGWFRADSLEELVGLDLAYMGGNRKKNTSSGGGDDISAALEARTAEDAFEKRQDARRIAKRDNRSSLKSVATKSVDVVEEEVEGEAPDDVSAISH